jgi:DGQHR domain-containing protein
MEKQYFGFKVKQRMADQALSLFVFCASAQDLIQWVGIKRNYQHERGIQRYLMKTRVDAITKFLAVDKINTIPNNILIAFDDGVAHFTSLQSNLESIISEGSLSNAFDPNLMEWGVLSFSYNETELDHEKPALIVDGQHRLHGVSDYKEENLPLIAVALLDSSPVEQAFQFIVINKKAKSVETDDAKSILADFVKDKEDELSNRLQQVRIAYKDTSLVQYINDEESSPFYQTIDWSRTQRQLGDNEEDLLKVKVTAIESCLKYIRERFEHLFKNDDDSLIFFFFRIWDVVKNYYQHLWRENYQFMSPLSINIVNKFMVDKISAAWSMELIDDPLNFEQVTKFLFKTFERIPQEFWQYDWGYFDNNNYYRKIIENSLHEIEINVRTGQKWDYNLSIINLFQENLASVN